MTACQPSPGPASYGCMCAADDGGVANGGDAGGGGHDPSSSKSQVFDDATAEIADIDSRLHALQSFLRMAKSSSSTATSTALA